MSVSKNIMGTGSDLPPNNADQRIIMELITKFNGDNHHFNSSGRWLSGLKYINNYSANLDGWQ